VIVQVENAYWDMAEFQENVKLAEQSLAASQQQLANNQEMAKIGTLAELDVVSSEATVAAAERDLVLARTNLQFQQNQFKTILSKRMDPDVEAAEIVTTDPLPEPRDADIPDLQTTLTEAYNRRSSLRIAQVNLLNEQISTQYTANNLLPVGNVFAQYAGAGLQGNTAAVSGKPASQSGVSDSLTQMIQGSYPEYSGGFSLTLPISNRTAQADNLRAQLEAQQAEVSVQQIRNQVSLQVRQAMTGVVQGKAQVQAAHQAARLDQQTLQTEQGKLTAGVSTPYNVILRQRDFVAAQQAEVQTMATYAKSLVALDNARGGIAERNGILIQDALSGTITQTPVSPFKSQPNSPGGR
jgi:outer membrane protein TolC